MNTERKTYPQLLTALCQVGTHAKGSKLVGPLGQKMFEYLIPPHVILIKQYQNENACLKLADSVLEQIKTKSLLEDEKKITRNLSKISNR